MHDLERRAQAVRATLDRWQGKPFAWGEVDCVRVGASHLRAMGHHARLGLHKAGRYRTAIGAKRALARAGYRNIADALQSAGFLQIAPAMALPGDLIVTPGTDEWQAVVIFLGNGAALGFTEGYDTLEIIRIGDWSAATGWRV